jgi:hypothetical protein
MATYDAILILGGGVREGGNLPPWAQRRYDLALEIQSGEPLVCLSAATTHRAPPLDEHGFPIFEAVAGARYLFSRGVPAGRLYIEAASWDTIGNAYFAKCMHVDPAGWFKLLVITSAFHMPRSRVVFEWVYGLDPDRKYDLSFVEASDEGLDLTAIEARKRKEAEALEKFRRIADVIHSVPELHRWLFTEHAAYNVTGDSRAHRSTDPGVLSSY